jgi:hypothetical protein
MYKNEEYKILKLFIYKKQDHKNTDESARRTILIFLPVSKGTI